MTLREVLQIELWSKQTTRKMLVALKWAGVGIGSALAAIVLWVLVWTHWLTAGERSTGREALAQVEILENIGAAADSEFDVHAKLAQEKVDAANNSILTARDRLICTSLGLYLDEIQWMRSDKKMREQLDSRPVHTRSQESKELELNAERSQRELVKMLRESLHKSLDK